MSRYLAVCQVTYQAICQVPYHAICQATYQAICQVLYHAIFRVTWHVTCHATCHITYNMPCNMLFKILHTIDCNIHCSIPFSIACNCRILEHDRGSESSGIASLCNEVRDLRSWKYCSLVPQALIPDTNRFHKININRTVPPTTQVGLG